ncbi:hypothetical protein KHA94_24365 [Bacillus sp. FJAT-49705]|uniref:Argininosuccinate lyase n=1 Tax=Cytobacillus citreus TaxID=2833586 RepID=A0ABS5P0I4_9BACI|nr:hypothetical protein [Cytobacillus citreus]MBS4193229.1 hypothetical protein [Cytobacillus citreus]
MEKFNTSLPVDHRLYYQDITGSIAHVKMLVKCNLLSEAEGILLIDGLESILRDIESGLLKWKVLMRISTPSLK